MAPDLDALIRSSSDPLLTLEFHRQVTHSLLFIPIGGLLCALLLYPLLGKRWGFSFISLFIVCLTGYATHGLLDGCTSYGTQLFWPLSNERYAWSSISIIDPLFTIPLLFLSILAAVKKSKKIVTFATIWAISYLSLGFIQHYRAINIGEMLAQQRGHQPIRLEVKPSFGNLIVWKVIYEVDNKYYVDAVKPGLFTNQTWQGVVIDKLNIQRDFPWLDSQSQQSKDIERFRWFSNDFLSVDPENSNRIIDMRYSLVPNQINALWGIELLPDAEPTDHIRYQIEHNDKKKSFNTLWSMIIE